MYAVSEQFLRAIRSSGQRRTLIDVRVAFSDTAYLFRDIGIVDGSITVDRNSDTYRSGRLKIGDKSLTDAFFTAHSGPFGMEIVVRSGPVYPRGDSELVPLGVFNIEDFSWEEGDGGLPELVLYDRSRYLQRSPFLTPRDLSGMLCQEVIAELIHEVMPGVEILFQDGLNNPRLPGGSVYDDSRWDVIKQCAEMMGSEVFFSPIGQALVREIPDPVGNPEDAVWDVNVGEGYSDTVDTEEGGERLVEVPPGVLVSATRSITRVDTFNAVAVYGVAPDGTTAQAYALAFDSNPDSPTYFNGPFGRSTLRIDNPLLVSNAQCADAAVSNLRNSLGLSRSVSFSSVGNPALEAGDYVLFTFGGGGQEVHILDSFSIPLGAGDFSGDTRTSPMRQHGQIGVIVTEAQPDTPPGRPGTPTVSTNAGAGTATLAWTAAVTGGSSGLAYYRILLNGDPVAETEDLSITLGSPDVVSGGWYLASIVSVGYNGLESAPTPERFWEQPGEPLPEPPTRLPDQTKVYMATWSQAYTGGNQRATWHGNEIHQGVVSGGNGNMRSLIGFNDAQIRKDLAGRTILKVEFRMHYHHWWSNSGGTAIIGWHNVVARPSSWNSAHVTPNRWRISGWKRGETKTISLGISVGSALKSGSIKGIAIGPAPNSTTQYYGRARGAGTTLAPRLIIKFR
jgi:hypothetical protein